MFHNVSLPSIMLSLAISPDSLPHTREIMRTAGASFALLLQLTANGPGAHALSV